MKTYNNIHYTPHSFIVRSHIIANEIFVCKINYIDIDHNGHKTAVLTPTIFYNDIIETQITLSNYT